MIIRRMLVFSSRWQAFFFNAGRPPSWLVWILCRPEQTQLSVSYACYPICYVESSVQNHKLHEIDSTCFHQWPELSCQSFAVLCNAVGHAVVAFHEVEKLHSVEKSIFCLYYGNKGCISIKFNLWMIYSCHGRKCRPQFLKPWTILEFFCSLESLCHSTLNICCPKIPYSTVLCFTFPRISQIVDWCTETVEWDLSSSHIKYNSMVMTRTPRQVCILCHLAVHFSIAGNQANKKFVHWFTILFQKMV